MGEKSSPDFLTMAKIGIDARLYGVRHAGIGRYTQELIKSLQRFKVENEWVVFCRKEDADDIPDKSGWRKVVADVPHYTVKEQLILPKILEKSKLDLLHFPHFNVPILYKRPFVVTIHDVLWHDVRGLGVTTQPASVYLTKYLGYRVVIKNAIIASAKIIVPIKTVKGDLIKMFGVSESKVVVTYEGVSYETASPKQTNVLAKYKIKKPYLLYVGSLYPHKNVESAVRAAKEIKPHLSLVVVCARSFFWERFKKFIEKEKAEGFVSLIGQVPDSELGAFYKNAQAFIFPTLSEGFGLPGLEAMAAGTPVLCSDIPVLREIYGDAALYFESRSHADVAEKIRQIITDQKLRAELIKKSKEQVKKYSWRKMAKETLTVYEEVLGK